MSDIIVDRKSATALVEYERDRSKVVYADYIANNGVTLDNVAAHVQALAALAFPGFDHKTADDDAKRERKGFCSRVRNGLNYRLGKVSSKAAPKDDENGSEDAESGAESGAENGSESAPVTLTVADMSTTGLSSLAEDVIHELAVRANAGDGDAMRTLNTLGEAIDAADVRPIVDGSRQAVDA